jgi:hypothetical protein
MRAWPRLRGGSGNTDRGGFTLGATSASFKALRNTAPPADVRIVVSARDEPATPAPVFALHFYDVPP